MNLLLRTLTGLAAAMLTPAAQAGPLSPTDIFGQFNAVAFGNFTSSSDVEGRAVVGGNLTGGATFDLKPTGAASSSFSALNVYGSATGGGSVNINNAGGMTIQGSNNISFNLNGGGMAYVGGSNSGTLNLSSGTDAVVILGTNSATVSLSSGGSIYLGAGTTGGLSAGGSAAVSINGDNSANMNLNGGGTVSLNGSNAGTISLNGGSLKYTGSQTGNLNLNNGAKAAKVTNLTLPTPTSPLPSFAATFQAPLTALSTQLDKITPNSTVTSSNGSVVFNARPDASGTAVFDIGTSLLSANSTAAMALNNAVSVIINVAIDGCGSANCAYALPNSLNFSNPGSFAPEVLWNFVNATSLTFSSEFGGSILAPLASVTNSGPIDGTLVAASYAGNGELHSAPYRGTLPNPASSGTSGASIAMPEPKGLALIAIAITGLAAARRRRHGIA